jgi:hypothetical protein
VDHGISFSPVHAVVLFNSHPYQNILIFKALLLTFIDGSLDFNEFTPWLI